MSVFIQSRALLPSFLFRASALAWHCSLCGKMFSISVEEAEQRPDTTPPSYIERAFRVHNCALVLIEEQEKTEAILLTQSWKTRSR